VPIRLRAGVAFALALLVIIVPPAGAWGSTLRFDEQTVREGPNTFTVRSLVYEAAAGEANETTISRVPGGFVVADPGATISAEAPCTSISPSEAACSDTDVEFVKILVGDLDDSVLGAEGGTTIDARGGIGNDVLRSGAHEDFLFGGPGNDRLEGGPEFDVLDGGSGADTLGGGGDTDIVDYSRRTAPVRVDFDGRANDGERGERDTLRTDVEGAGGGAGDDILVGNRKANLFFGGRGDDRLTGRAGFDAFQSGPGDDTLSGGRGTDVLEAGPGDDVLVGGGGFDVLMGNEGRDTFFARDGARDAVEGASGRDRACVDQGLDTVVSVEVLCPTNGGRLAG
jgi:Ca2+-binding RTX toxin-like protein